jgi:prepilin-type N-terminal cleavage/methylation domain-containing protein
MESGKTRATSGFTLLELSISMALLSIISLMAFTVINGVTASVKLSSTKDQVQGAVRDTLSVMSAELEQASRKTNTGLTPPLQALAVLSASSVRFQVPVDNTGTVFSQPITYALVNEDANGNGRLDAGEDANGDGTLTRRITRTQNGVTRSIGAANNISSVQFALNATGDLLAVTVTASQTVINARHDLVQATASSSIYLHN